MAFFGLLVIHLVISSCGMYSSGAFSFTCNMLAAVTHTGDLSNTAYPEEMHPDVI